MHGTSGRSGSTKGGGRWRRNAWTAPLEFGVRSGWGVVAACAAVAVPLYIYYQTTNVDCAVVKKIVLAMKNSRIPTPSVTPFVARNELMRTLTATITRASDLTLIVSGPRGSGKTTAVHLALKDRNATMCVEFCGTREELFRDLCAALIGVHSKPETTEWSTLFLKALQQLPSDIKPVIVVEVDSSCSAQQLHQLLNTLKLVGLKKNLATCVVVLSESRVTAGLTIGVNQLRCRYFVVQDLTECERDAYLKQTFSHCVDESQVEELTKTSAEALGCRILHLHTVHQELCTSEDSQADSVEAVQSIVEEYAASEVLLCSSAIYEFQALNNIPRKQLKEVFMQLLERKTLHVVRAADALGVSVHTLTDNVPLTAHLFYHPSSQQMSLASEFMAQAAQLFLVDH